MRYHLTPVRTAITKKSTNNMCWRGSGEKGSFMSHGRGCKVVRLLWKPARRFRSFIALLWKHGQHPPQSQQRLQGPQNSHARRKAQAGFECGQSIILLMASLAQASGMNLPILGCLFHFQSQVIGILLFWASMSGTLLVTRYEL